MRGYHADAKEGIHYARESPESDFAIETRYVSIRLLVRRANLDADLPRKQ